MDEYSREGEFYMKEQEHKCQVSGCNRNATKEVHLFPEWKGIFFFCEEHFKKEERHYDSIYQPREIYNLEPTENEREIVQFS